MARQHVWFITGAGRGMGVDIAQAALAAGHAVVATGRDADRGRRRPSASTTNLLAVALDITDPAAAAGRRRRRRRAVRPHRRARQQRRQLLRRLLRGDQPRAVPRADGDELLRPAQRDPRRSCRSCAGSAPARSSPSPRPPASIGQEFCAAYAASKFALEGWMESLALRRGARSASTPWSSSPASSAPSCSSRAPRRSGRSCRSTTTPSAPRRPSRPGKA